MKVIKTASGKKQIKMSKKEWLEIGKTAGWNPSEPFSTQQKFYVGDKVLVTKLISAEAAESGEDTAKGVITEVIPVYLNEESPDQEPYDYEYEIKFDEGTNREYFSDDETWSEDDIIEWD
jgi:hypothetical protein